MYLDARHDFCSVLEDMEAWRPKLRRGGVLAGDDANARADGGSCI